LANKKRKKEAEDQSFEELGMDAHLLRALHKKGIAEPTPIQGVAIPLILVMLFSNFTFAIHHSTSLQPKLVHSLFPGRQGRGCTRQNRFWKDLSIYSLVASKTFYR